MEYNNEQGFDTAEFRGSWFYVITRDKVEIQEFLEIMNNCKIEWKGGYLILPEIHTNIIYDGEFKCFKIYNDKLYVYDFSELEHDNIDFVIYDWRSKKWIIRNPKRNN